ncbi:hypothetical protein CON64_05595, partial [Bacillus pseudomycoides]
RLSVAGSNALRFWANRFRFSKEDRWGTTARKSPIGRANHQWGMKKTPTDGSFTLYRQGDSI